MDNLINVLKSVIVYDVIDQHILDLMKEPMFWIFTAILIICFSISYSNSNHNKLSGSIINTLRQFGTFIIDSINSVLQAIKSIFGFLDVVRLLFFGKVSPSTLFVLTNYAIVFLSIASFSTTMQGLHKLIGWIGFFVSFGIQVLELVSIMGIIALYIPAKHKTKENIV